MKKSLIAISIAAAVAAPMANAAPKVYGKLNLSVESYKKDFENPVTKDEEFTRSVSNASRFGVKGEDELTADLSAVYGIEWEVAADGEDASGIAGSSKLDLTQRNRFLGIKSQKLGTVKLGKYDTYTKLAQGEIDLFNDYQGDMKFIIAGENRINNVVGYESPKLLDAITINVQLQTQDSVTPANGNSASVVYNNEENGIYAALAFDNNITGATALSGTRESDNIRLVGSYKIQDLTLNAIYGTSEQSSVAAGGNKNKEASWQLGAAYKLGDEVLKLQYGEAKADNSAATTQKHTQLSVGVDHNFTSKTKAFAWYTTQKEDKLAVNADYTLTALAAGVEHKF
ncbi:putative porin [Fluviicoccus keumensis]|uniref:Putative porin n=1 Tax=Fluviicoccus keumensis TaxID=1435465 RepID=A0A4Q7Z4Q4_9GAMM|nr:porin [Fluviicoccus keumensis]RZU45258.1 putative porin [Fluviicoccus keumensis]